MQKFLNTNRPQTCPILLISQDLVANLIEMFRPCGMCPASPEKN